MPGSNGTVERGLGGTVKQVRKTSQGKLGLALSGGGARGAFQVGVYEQLLRDPRFDRGAAVVSGTSAGAINGALIAAGRSPKEMMDFWNGIADDPPVVASPAFFHSALRTLARLSFSEGVEWIFGGQRRRAFLQRARNHFPPRRGSLLAVWVEYLLATRFELVSHFLEGITVPYVADTKKLRQRLVDTFGGEKIVTDGIELAVNSVDAHTGEVVRYVTCDTPVTRNTAAYVIVDNITVDMLLASASIPLLFPPVAIGPHLLWDGGLLVNTPLAPVVAMGADEIVTVLVTEPPDPERKPLPHFGRAVERTVDALLENAYNVDRMLLLERNRLAQVEGSHYREVTLYESLRPARDGRFNAGSYLYFERGVLAEMRRAGQRAAKLWLSHGPVVDRLTDTQAGAAA